MRKLLLAGACASAFTLACSQYDTAAPTITDNPTAKVTTDVMLSASNPFAKAINPAEIYVC